MDEEATEQFLGYLKTQRLLVDYFQVAAFTILLYDYLLTLRWELELVWLRSWSYTKVLFIITRYTPLASVYFMMHNQMLLGVHRESCLQSFHAATWLGMISISLAEIILAIRTWAVCHCDIRVGLLLGILQLSNIVVACVSAECLLRGIDFKSAPYSGFRGCFVARVGDPIYANFLFLTCMEAVILCLMTGCALRAYRLGLTDEFSNVIYRDVIHFYVFLMVLAVANVVVIIHSPNLLKPLQAVLHSTFTSRIIINIRIADDRTWKLTTDLHTFRPEYSRESPVIIWARRSGEAREEGLPMDEIPMPDREA